MQTNTVPQSAPPSLSDAQLIDTIVYLTSLASETKAIDADLETLRSITAVKATGVELTQDERVALQHVIAKIKDYLIHRDPLRDFTEETLEQRLQATAQNKLAPKKAFGYGTAILVSLAGSLPVVLLPSTLSVWDRVFLAPPIFILATALLNCWFYLSSMQNFKAELRRVFTYFCIGSIVLGAQFIHFISITLLHQEQEPMFKYGGLTIFASVALLLIYIGLRKYAHILSINNRFTSAKLFLAVQALTTVAAIAVPFIMSVPDKLFYGFSIFSLFTLMTNAVFGVGVSRAIMRSVTAAYAASMKWLFLFTISAFVGPLIYVSLIIIRGELSGSALGAALGLCALPPMLLLMYSGYSFKKETGR